MKPNPPIPGHGLRFEGRWFYSWHLDRIEGGCECGAVPPGVVPEHDATGPSAGATKRWHRDHKAALRGES